MDSRIVPHEIFGLEIGDMKVIRNAGGQLNPEVEKDIDENYLIQLNDAYTHFFYHYTETPLLIVNTSTINLAKNESDYEDLVRYLLTKKISRNYYNPTL